MAEPTSVLAARPEPDASREGGDGIEVDDLRATARTPRAGRVRRQRYAPRQPLVLYTVCRALLVLVARRIPPRCVRDRAWARGHRSPRASLDRVFAQWDGAWYLWVAGAVTRALSEYQRHLSDVAFFPLFPAMIRGLATVTGCRRWTPPSSCRSSSAPRPGRHLAPRRSSHRHARHPGNGVVRLLPRCIRALDGVRRDAVDPGGRGVLVVPARPTVAPGGHPRTGRNGDAAERRRRVARLLVVAIVAIVRRRACCAPGAADRLVSVSAVSSRSWCSARITSPRGSSPARHVARPLQFGAPIVHHLTGLFSHPPTSLDSGRLNDLIPTLGIVFVAFALWWTLRSTLPLAVKTYTTAALVIPSLSYAVGPRPRMLFAAFSAGDPRRGAVAALPRTTSCSVPRRPPRPPDLRDHHDARGRAVTVLAGEPTGDARRQHAPTSRSSHRPVAPSRRRGHRRGRRPVHPHVSGRRPWRACGTRSSSEWIEGGMVNHVEQLRAACRCTACRR